MSEKKVFTTLPLFAELLVVLATALFIACCFLAHTECTGNELEVLNTLGFCYLLCSLFVFISAIMMTILNVAQKKGHIIYSGRGKICQKYWKSYLLADNWYISFLWLWFVAMMSPFSVLWFSYSAAVTIVTCFFGLTILYAVIVHIRAIHLAIRRSRL